MALVVLLVGCRVLRDFYPLNSFPMYADPGPEPSEFVVISDGDDRPVDIRRITGETSAKVKKKYIDARNELATAAGIRKADEATPEICLKAWQDVAGRLERLAQRRKKELPPELHLKIGLLFQENGAFREEYKDIGAAKVTPYQKKSAAPTVEAKL